MVEHRAMVAELHAAHDEAVAQHGAVAVQLKQAAELRQTQHEAAVAQAVEDSADRQQARHSLELAELRLEQKQSLSGQADKLAAERAATLERAAVGYQQQHSAQSAALVELQVQLVANQSGAAKQAKELTRLKARHDDVVETRNELEDKLGTPARFPTSYRSTLSTTHSSTACRQRRATRRKWLCRRARTV